ncbi:MAG: DUF1080 domain-containing protein [Chloroherpetonaceae bacterium]|nr:DUF1080 domain-containing protein [Chthonomonadaceae bacterium]MDW8207675.1 DUF1080 domain-containing protein [Chloroherpetonaceae bacterium]
MKHWNHNQRYVALILTGGIALGCAALQMQARTQEAPQAPAPVVLPLPSQPPRGALVLYGGRAEHLTAHWAERYTGAPSQWKRDAEGVLTPNGKDITTKQEFGDVYLHVEFRIPVDGSGKTIGHGNSGIGLQGRYEIQIMDSYGQKPEAHNNGALYSQLPAQVNASRKPGEWQAYDIIFRAPRLNAEGKVVEMPRATVFLNGVLIQNNAEFRGMTGIQYGQFKEMTRTGPLILQGDHDPVQYRNIWVVPL